MTNTNLEKGIPWRFGPDWQGQRCDAKTRKGTACQKPPLIGKARGAGCGVLMAVWACRNATLYSHTNFKLNRAAALAEWRQLLSA